MRVLGQMSRIAGKFLAAIVMAAPLLCAAPAHAGGAGNCGGSVLGLAGTETCGAYKNDASDVTNPNDLHGFTVSTGGDLVFRNGVALSGLEHMRLTATGSLGLGTGTPKVSVDFGSNADALLLQTGTTGQRPATPSAGMVRYNSTTPAIEAYVSNAWTALGGGSSTLGTSAGAAGPYKTGEVGTGLFSDTASTVEIATGATERLRVTATGSVGIGTTTPTAGLAVNTNGAASTSGVRLNGTWYTAGTSATTKPQLLVEPSSVSSAGWSTSGTGIGVNAASGFAGNLMDLQVAGVSKFRADNSGQLFFNGGTSAGNILLNGSANQIRVVSNLGSGGSVEAMYNSNTPAAGQVLGIFNMGDGNALTASMRGVSLENHVIGTAYGTGIAFYTTLTGTITPFERVRIGNNGNFGIGTTAPLSKLDVSGGVAVGTYAGTATAPSNGLVMSGSLGVGTSSPTSGASIDFGSKTDSLLLPTGTTGQRPTATAGMVRYNSTTPGVEAYVSNAWTALGGGSTLGTSAGAASPYKTGEVGTGLFSDTASTVQIATGAVERLRVTATGSLGLGTTTPKASVDLSAKTDGLILQTASAAANQACTSSLTGAIRYNSNLTNIEFCTGSAWSRVVLSTCDNTAAVPNFGDVTNLATSQLTSSSIALVTGMDSGCTVTVGVSGTGGSPEYRVCSDSGCSSVVQNWTSSNNTIDIQGKYMQLRATSSASVSTAYTITAAIGPVNATWIMSTGMSGCAPAGTVCSDGTVYAGLSGASTPMYVTRCDAGQSWSGSACTGSRTTYSWNNGNLGGWVLTSTSTTDGQSYTATLITTDSDSNTAGTQQHLAAQYCADLVNSGLSDWYLPSKTEINTIYTNSVAIGNFSTGTYYWSSSEFQDLADNAYMLDFNSGYQWGYLKSNAYYVRCARR